LFGRHPRIAEYVIDSGIDGNDPIEDGSLRIGVDLDKYLAFVHEQLYDVSASRGKTASHARARMESRHVCPTRKQEKTAFLACASG